jgi:hypothetical protein
MKYKGLKAIYYSIITSIAFVLLDIFLIFYNNFIDDLIFLYVLVAIIPICCILTIIGDIGIPMIVFDDNSKTIRTFHIKDERKTTKKSDYATKMRLLFATIYFDEIVSVDVNNKILTVALQSGYKKVLYMTSFTKKQILCIAKKIADISF